MRTEGKIVFWDDDKGFGFIEPSNGGGQVFLHIKSLRNSSKRPVINQLVTYSLSSDKQGRPRAAKATLAGDKTQDKDKRKKGSLSILIAALFLCVVVISVLTARIPPLILGLYLVLSLLTFVMYARDKAAAEKGAWRTQENTLHMLSLVGGWPGALIAQQQLRHKTNKKSFRSVFRLTVLLNCGAFIWLFTPSGAAMLHFFIVRLV